MKTLRIIVNFIFFVLAISFRVPTKTRQISRISPKVSPKFKMAGDEGWSVSSVCSIVPQGFSTAVVSVTKNRTCRQCKKQYTPGSSEKCSFHPGIFSGRLNRINDIDTSVRHYTFFRTRNLTIMCYRISPLITVCSVLNDNINIIRTHICLMCP